jgi:hypothetical protein
MTQDRLKLAAWFSILNAVITIPIIILGFIIGLKQNIALDFVLVLLSTLSILILIYILLTFKGLLNSYFSFYNVDTIIAMFIWANVFLTGANIVPSFLPEYKVKVGIFTLMFVLLFGILNIMLGAKLLKLKEDLFGLLKPFSYLTIATGILCMTIVLLPLGMITDVISSILLAIIFFRATKCTNKSSEENTII